MNAVIFDMDGVLFDTERLAIECWDTVGEKIGLGKLGYMVFKTMGRTTPESVKIFQNEFGDRFDNDIFQKEIKEFNDNYFEKHGVPMKEGLVELLKFLDIASYKTAVASSSSKKSVLHHLCSTDIDDYFDAVICGDMVKKSKPEPDIYLTASAILGEEPQNCYAVEDSRAGLISAHNAGCKVVYIPDLYEADEEILKLVDFKFNSLTEFMEHLKKECD